MRGLLPLILIGCCARLLAAPITIRMMGGPYQGIPSKEATDPRSLARRAVFDEFHRRNPDVRVVNAGGLELTGDQQESSFLMSMAGDTAPDVFYVNFRQYYNYIDQGFCRPLDDLVAKDPSVLARANPTILKVLRSYDGKLYAIPWYQVAMALYYRRDYFEDAGLDPNKPPRTWDELIADARKLTRPDLGRVGYEFSGGPQGRAYHWVDYVWQAGGDVVAPGQNGEWKSVIASPESAKALDFYRRQVSERWRGLDGRLEGPAARISATYSDDIASGRVSMWMAYTNDVVLNMTDVNPALLGCAQLPAGPAGRANEINAGMWAINASINDPKKLEACWRFVKYFAGDEAARVNTERFVEMGLGPLVNPSWLKRFGYESELANVSPEFVEANEKAFSSGHPEPYGRNCQQVYTVLDEALDLAVLQPDRPSIDILKQVQGEMDRVLLGYTPPEEMARRRAWALALALTFGVVAVGMGIWLFRRGAKFAATTVEHLPAGAKRTRVVRFLTLCLLPAVISLVVWAYYPLARGLLIAFQDYRIMRPAHWVGFDNFIEVFTQQVFWRSLLNSVLYVALTLIIGFFLPIFLALALHEIPRFKLLFRTLFYLPAMTSSIVVAFLFRQFYDKSDQGVLNSALAGPTDALNAILGWLHAAPIDKAHDWLGNPTLAMFAVVLPGIWAGAGPGSILYLVALKNIPAERYEAADMDGANWRRKITAIVLPGLRPLILINLLGVFIASFKATDNVFILTNGGPLNATRTLGLEIWSNAFLFLKFGYATAAAWVMGALLVGFTVAQIRTLLGTKFGAAKST